MLQIKSPIWKDKAIGIAINGLPDEYKITLEITAQNKKGFRYYPNPFTITVAEVRRLKIRIEDRVGNRPTLYIVPIIALHEIKPRQDNSTSGEGTGIDEGTGE